MSAIETNQPVRHPGKYLRWPLLTAILLVIITVWWFRFAPTELDRYKAQLIAQGEILDLDQLAPKRTGLETDGLEFLLSISNNLTPWIHTNSFYDHSWQPSGSGQLHLTFPRAFSPTNRAANWRTLEALIASNRVDIAIIRYAFEHGNPPKDRGLDYRLGLDYPNASPTLARRFAPLLSVSTIADIHARAHPDESFASLTGLLGLTDYLAEERNYPLQHQRARFIEEARLATWYALESHVWDEAKLSQLQAKWMTVSFLTNVYHALLMNRAQIGVYFTVARQDRDKMDAALAPMYTYYPPTHADHKLWEWWWYRFGIDADELMSLQLHQASLDIWRQMLQYPNWADGIAQIREAQTGWEDELNSDAYKAKRYRLTYWAGVYSSRYFGDLIGTETRRVQTITAIALERHRLKHSHYPETLARLIPEFLPKLPQDPMDGRPMRYRLNPDGTYTLWSIGFDGKDNHGDPAMTDPINQKYPQDARDLVWPKLDPIDLPPKP